MPYGYYVKDKKLHIDEEKAKIVRFIYEQYSASVYVPKIICKLNEKGVLHNGKPFLPNAIYGILRNKRYVGITEIRNEIYDNIYPQIVPKDLFDKIKRAPSVTSTGGEECRRCYQHLRRKRKMPISYQTSRHFCALLLYHTSRAQAIRRN